MRFTKEQKLLHHLVLHCNDVPSATGLLKGEMGIVLVLAHYAKVRNNPYIEKVADFLLDKVLDNLTKTEDIGFATGLAGVGWGIEYLIQNGYMKGDSIAICEEIDQRIMSVDIRRMQDKSLDNGLKGLLTYLLAHLQGGMKKGRLAFDTNYINDWARKLKILSEENQEDTTWAEGLRHLDDNVNGRQCSFPLTLSTFVRPMRRCSQKMLGLQEGMAGYIEIMLDKAKHDTSGITIINKKKSESQALGKDIYIIDEHISSKQNGVGTYMRLLLECLKSAQPNVLGLVSFNADCKDFSITKKEGIIHYDFPMFASGEFITHGGLSLPLLRLYIEDNDRNVFFVNHSPCADFLKTLRRIFPKSKIVFTIHDQGWTAPLLGNAEYLKEIVGYKEKGRNAENGKPLPKFISQKTKRFVQKYFKDERLMYKTSDAVICLSPSTKKLVETVYGVPRANLHLIPNGIGVDSVPLQKEHVRRQLNISNTDKVFFFVGRPVKAKGIEALLKAFESISYKFPECRLVIAGECHGTNSFIKLAPHACTRITFTGLVPWETMALWYKAADFGVLPSYTEQCSFTGLEMMAYSLPIITTDGNGLSDMFENGVNAIVASVGDWENEDSFVKNIIAAIEKSLMLSEAEKESYRRQGIGLIKSQYSATRMKEAYMRLLTNL